MTETMTYRDALESKTLAELRKLGGGGVVKGASRMNKGDLIDALVQVEVAEREEMLQSFPEPDSRGDYDMSHLTKPVGEESPTHTYTMPQPDPDALPKTFTREEPVVTLPNITLQGKGTVTPSDIDSGQRYKTDGQGNIIDLSGEGNRQQRRNERQVIREHWSENGVHVDIGQGTMAGGRASGWAVRCSECGWIEETHRKKKSAAKAAARHVASHKEG